MPVFSSAFSRPRFRRMTTADGRTLIPTPLVVRVDAVSKMWILMKPLAYNANAAARPPIPAPTMRILGWVSG